jgi:hypothetical protein
MSYNEKLLRPLYVPSCMKILSDSEVITNIYAQKKMTDVRDHTNPISSHNNKTCYRITNLKELRLSCLYARCNLSPP